MAVSNLHTDFYISGPTAALSDLMPLGEAVRNARTGMTILLTTAGEARIRIDDTSYRLSPGSVAVLMPFHRMASEMQSDDFSFRCLCFDFDFMADFPLLIPPEDSERFSAMPFLQADERSFATLMSIYVSMQEYALMQEHPYRSQLVKAQLFIFVAELLFRYADSARSIRRNRGEELTGEFFRLLHRHYKTQRSLAFYADRLCVTTKYLSKVIRRTSGHTVYFWIEEFTVREAKQLLRSTQATVTEIAEQLDFPNSSFFAKFFRRHTGLSPIQFRQRR